MHEKIDMICAQYGESSLTSEVSHDNLHHRCILAEEETEREKLYFFILVPGLEVRLKILITQVLCFVPSLPYIWNPCSISNNRSGNGKSYTCESYPVIMEVQYEKPIQLRVMLKSFQLFTKLIASNIYETRHG